MLPLTLVTLALESGELMSEVSLGGASVATRTQGRLCREGNGNTGAGDLSTKAKNITLLGASKVRQENKVLVVCSVRPCTCIITSHLIFIVTL